MHNNITNDIIERINSAIISGNLNSNDIRSINEALGRAFKIVAQDVKNSLQVGDRIKFVNKHGVLEHGVVRRLLTKNVEVLSDAGMTWRMTPTLVNLASGPEAERE